MDRNHGPLLYCEGFAFAACFPVVFGFISIRFLFYYFYILLLVACFPVAVVVDNDCQKRNLIGTDLILGKRLARAHQPEVYLEPKWLRCQY